MTRTREPWSTVPARRDTVEHIRALKRGGESYDELLRKMAETYQREALDG